MSWTDTDPFDRYDHDALEAHIFDTHIDKLLRDYDDARAALKTIKPGMDRTERWMILDRAVQTAQALELERTREPLETIGRRIVAEIRGAA